MERRDQTNRLIFLHASFWIVYATFFIYYVSSYQRAPDIDWGRIFTIAALQISAAMITSYFNYFYLLPKYLFKKKIMAYTGLFLISFGVVVFLKLQLERYLLDGFTEQEAYLYRTRFIVQTYFSNFSIVLFVSLLKFAVDWLDLQATRKEVERERLTAELNFLKAQINPHFLFNTLNNLYYLAYSKSEHTTGVIEKLSQMMRYMIYDTNYPQVHLTKEIDYMQNYISLEKLRLSDKIIIEFSIDGDVETIKITPLILLTFLENAFKHGVTSSSQESWIKVWLKCEGSTLHYKVSNSKAVKSGSEEKSGIGLQNVKRRLELSYPDKYKLDIQDTPDKYTVQLDIQLS